VDDIVDRLRRGWHRKDASGRVAHEAADEIERLRAENEATKAALEAWRTAAKGAGNQAVQRGQRINQLEADLEDACNHADLETARADDLQSKIDAWAEAFKYATRPKFMDDKYLAAHHALLAAATPKKQSVPTIIFYHLDPQEEP
jgi:chromosome segregation ATPase